MLNRRRQTNVELAATVLVVALLVLSSVGAIVLIGTEPVAAQSNETGVNESDAGNETEPNETADDSGGPVTETPPGTEPTDNATTTTATDNDTTTTEGGNTADSDSGSSDRVDSAVPDTNSGANESGNATGNETGNATPSDSATNPTPYSTGGGGGDSGDDDSGLFSVTIDPVGVLLNLFEPFFTLGTDILTGMAEALQSSTVYPMQDGSVAISGEPDNDLMSVLWEYWYGVGLVVGAAIWLINTVVLYLLGMVWPPTPTYQEIKIAQQEAWIKLVLIPFSWALATIILFVASFALNAVPLDPEVIAPDMSSVAANNAAAGISVLLFYIFGGAFALGIAFTFLVTWLFLYIILPAIPILIAMSVPKVWILKPVAEAFEGVLELFPSAAFFPLPAVVVLSVGYSVLGAIESLLPGPAEWGAIPVSAVAIIVIWLLAFISSIYLFWFKRVGSGVGAILAGSVGIAAVSNALGRLGGGSAAGAGAGAAAGGAGGSGGAAAGGVDTAVNGHALESGDSGSAGPLSSGSSTSSPSPLSAGSSDLDSAGSRASAPTTAGTSTGPNPSGTALPSGSPSGSSPGSTVTTSASASDSASGIESDSAVSAGDAEGSMPGRIPVDDPSITTVETTDDLPDNQEYRMGYFTGTGPGSGIEYQKTLDVPRSTETVTGEPYRRADMAYEDRDLFVYGDEDNQFYDVRPAVEKNTGLGLSEAEQNAESRSTVDDARGS